MEKQSRSHLRVFNIEELSQFLNIPISSIYDLAKRGKIPGRKIGKHWRFLEAEILLFLRGACRPVPAMQPEGLAENA